MGAVTRRARPGLSPAFCARTRRLPSLPRWPAGLLSRLPPWPLPPRLSPKLFISFDLRLVQEAFPDPASDVRAPSPLALRRPPHWLVFALTAGALGPTGGDSSAGPAVTCRARRKGTRGRSIILSPGWFSVPPPPPPTSSLLPPSPGSAPRCGAAPRPTSHGLLFPQLPVKPLCEESALDPHLPVRPALPSFFLSGTSTSPCAQTSHYGSEGFREGQD